MGSANISTKDDGDATPSQGANWVSNILILVNVGTSLHTQSLLSLTLFPMEYTQETDNDGQVRYTCVREGSDASTEYRFSGHKGLPFMWRETIRSSS